jgi:hypothetical protein
MRPNTDTHIKHLLTACLLYAFTAHTHTHTQCDMGEARKGIMGIGEDDEGANWD